MTDVSVVIPSRNRWRFLRHALAAALAQRGVDHEVIVVLDGSTDESEARLAAIGDPRLSVVVRERQGGIATARNAGIAAARGEWVAFLDDDDRWSPDKLVHALSAGAGHDFVYGSALIVDEALRVIAHAPAPSPRTLLRALLVQDAIPAGSSNVVVRRGLLQSAGGFDETLVHMADWDLWIRLTQQGSPARCAHTDLACVEHGANLALTAPDGVRADLDLLEARYADVARSLDVRLDRALFDRWVARGQRRAGHRLRAAGLLLRSAIRYRNAGNLVRATDALVVPRDVRHRRGAPDAPDWLTAA